jgi:hypothetical protein
MRGCNIRYSATCWMFAEFVTHRQTPLGFADASRQRGDSSSRLRSPSHYMTAAHAQATTTTPRLHQVPDEGSAAHREFGALEARLAAASDLLNVAKALLV